jgi:hypothetical protein
MSNITNFSTFHNSTLTSFTWVNAENPEETLSAEVVEYLDESARSHIAEMTENGYQSGEYSTNIKDGKTFYECIWSVLDLTRPTDLLKHLVNNMQANILRLIETHGVVYKDVNVLDIGRFEFELLGDHIEYIGENKIYTACGKEVNPCVLQTELERVLVILEDLENNY